MQKKQVVQFVVLLVFLVAMIGAYLGIKNYNTAQEEKEQQEQEDAKITLTAFQPDDITKISYDYHGVTYQFEKSGQEWKSKDDSSLNIDQDAFESFLKSAGSIQAQTKVTPQENTDASENGNTSKADENKASVDNADTEYGFDKPSRTVTITREKGTSSLIFGMKNEMLGQYYVRTSESSQIYLVEESVYTAFDKEAEDFKKIESTDTDDESDADGEADTGGATDLDDAAKAD